MHDPEALLRPVGTADWRCGHGRSSPSGTYRTSDILHFCSVDAPPPPRGGKRVGVRDDVAVVRAHRLEGDGTMQPVQTSSANATTFRTYFAALTDKVRRPALQADASMSTSDRWRPR